MLFDSEDQAHGSVVVVVCGVDASCAVSLEKVFVAGGFIRHPLLVVGFIAEVGRR